jgi:lysozyme
MSNQRIVIAALSLSAVAFGGLVVKEHYTDEAVVPVKGDVPTLGFGMTKRPDGSPVELGDRTNPVEAIQRSLAHIQQDERGIKQCVTAPLHQAEYDLMVDFSYQYGVPTLCNSSIVGRANAGDYAGSCEAYLLYRRAGGYDCSTLINGKPNKRCWGVWVRQQERHAKCMAVQ